MKTLDHYGQIMRSKGHFANYDYGTKENLKKYGQKTPLVFPIENITTPIYLVYSTDDTVAYSKVKIIISISFYLLGYRYLGCETTV